MPMEAPEQGREGLMQGLLEQGWTPRGSEQGREDLTQGSSQPVVARSTAVGAFLFGGLALLGVVTFLTADDEASNLQATGTVRQQMLVDSAAAANTPTWYHHCTANDEFCDMRHNIRDELDFEAGWAHAFLNSLKEDRLNLYLSFFEKLRAHIAETRATRGPDCQNLHSWSDTLAFWKSDGVSPGLSGRSAANFADANYVLYKKAEDSTHKGGAACSWSDGAPGWGHDMTMVELALKGDRALISGQVWVTTATGYELLGNRTQDANKFMWSQKKGRGVDMDKVAMTRNIDRSIVTEAMGSTMSSVFAANKGETDEQRLMPAWRQRLLPGTVRWDATFMNDNFGIFSYGDGDGWVQEPDVRHFFYNRNVHGFGIFGRNLTAGNPAERMLEIGMPWIGGASGSLVDFYLAARDLGFKGEELADLMIVNMAALIAGGHHSLGELLIAAVEANNAGGEMTFQKNGKDFNYFDGPVWESLMKALDTMNEGQWNSVATATGAQGGGPTHYQAALEEFISRAGPADYKRGSSTLDRMRQSVQVVPALQQCLNLPGMPLFQSGLFNLGGPERAFASWKLIDLRNFEDGLSPAEFVTKIGPQSSSGVGLYVTRVFKEIAGAHDNIIEKELLHYGKRGGTPALVEFLAPLKHNVRKNLWGSSSSWMKYVPREARKWANARGEAEFADAVISALNGNLMDVHGCIAKATGAANKESIQALYSMSWL